jgi:hypothetical protein
MPLMTHTPGPGSSCHQCYMTSCYYGTLWQHENKTLHLFQGSKSTSHGWGPSGVLGPRSPLFLVTQACTAFACVTVVFAKCAEAPEEAVTGRKSFTFGSVLGAEVTCPSPLPESHNSLSMAILCVNKFVFKWTRKPTHGKWHHLAGGHWASYGSGFRDLAEPAHVMGKQMLSLFCFLPADFETCLSPSRGLCFSVLEEVTVWMLCLAEFFNQMVL